MFPCLKIFIWSNFFSCALLILNFVYLIQYRTDIILGNPLSVKFYTKGKTIQPGLYIFTTLILNVNNQQSSLYLLYLKQIIRFFCFTICPIVFLMSSDLRSREAINTSAYKFNQNLDHYHFLKSY